MTQRKNHVDVTKAMNRDSSVVAVTSKGARAARVERAKGGVVKQAANTGPSRSAGPRPRLRTLAAVLGAVTFGGAMLSSTTRHVSADSDHWANHRVLTCEIGGWIGEVDTYLPPAGFGAPFHLGGGQEVIVPMHVAVTFPWGETITTVDRPGFDRNGIDTVHCWYTDPVGLFVDLEGLMTPARS